MARTSTAGVSYVHSRSCRDRSRCAKTCNPSPEPWQAWVFDSKYVDPVSGTRGKKIYRRFASHQAAKGWRQDALPQVRKQQLRAVDRATTQKTLREEVDEWLAKARAGEIRPAKRGGQPYKPSVIRGYELALRKRILPTLGDRRLSDITLADLMELMEKLQGEGIAPGTVRNGFVPLAAIYRRARPLGRVSVDPTEGLELPSSGTRSRAASAADAAELLAVLPEPESAIWATAFYGGLRKGEIRALRVRNVDFDNSTLDVESGWDVKEGEIPPKSAAGVRRLFLSDLLRPHLEPLAKDRGPDELLFSFDFRAVDRKADRALRKANEKRADDEAEPVARYTLHEARHSFATWLADSGVVDYHADRYVGHSPGHVRNLYRHLNNDLIGGDRRAFDLHVAGVASGTVVPLAAAS